jgi:hypothetical protein
MIQQSIDLTEILTQEEIDSLPFSPYSEVFASDFIRACKLAKNEPIYVGKKDNHFPDPVSMTDAEMQAHAEFMHKEAQSSNLDYEQSLDSYLSEIYEAAQAIDVEIVRKVAEAAS